MISPPPETSGNVWKSFWLSHLGEWVGTRDAAKHPKNAQDSSLQQSVRESERPAGPRLRAPDGEGDPLPWEPSTGLSHALCLCCSLSLSSCADFTSEI